MLQLDVLPQQIFTRIVSGKPRTETRYFVPCPGCGSGRWLAGYNARRNEPCASCVPHSARARAGLAASREWRLKNPTKPECTLIRILHALGLPFVREAEISNGEGGSFFLDFLVADRYVIEYNGYHHHFHVERDDRKRHAVRHEGLEMLELEQRDLKDLENLRRTIGAFCRVLDIQESSPRVQ